MEEVEKKKGGRGKREKDIRKFYRGGRKGEGGRGKRKEGERYKKGL